MRMTTGLGLVTGLGFVGEPATPITSISETVRYKLHTNSGHMTNWGHTVGNDTVMRSGETASRSPTSHGQVAPQMTPAPGSYLDAMTVTVTY